MDLTVFCLLKYIHKETNELIHLGFTGDAEVLTSLRGKRFCESAMEILGKSLGESDSHHACDGQHNSSESEGERFVADCMRQVNVTDYYMIKESHTVLVLPF